MAEDLLRSEKTATPLSWTRNPASAALPLMYEVVTFRLAQEGRQAYVLVKAREGRPWQLCQMALAAPGQWEVTLRIRRGVYHYRFYLNGGGVTLLIPGWEGQQHSDAHGWHGVLIVHHAFTATRGADGQTNSATGGA